MGLQAAVEQNAHAGAGNAAAYATTNTSSRVSDAWDHAPEEASCRRAGLPP